MRMRLQVVIPHEPFNALVLNGTAGATIGKILETIKPEAAYFTETDGKRTAFLIVNVENASQIPFFAEPFFLKFNAGCKFHPVMLPEDLIMSDLNKMGKQWS
jgi:hypothetical protein